MFLPTVCAWVLAGLLLTVRGRRPGARHATSSRAQSTHTSAVMPPRKRKSSSKQAKKSAQKKRKRLLSMSPSSQTSRTSSATLIQELTSSPVVGPSAAVGVAPVNRSQDPGSAAVSLAPTNLQTELLSISRSLAATIEALGKCSSVSHSSLVQPVPSQNLSSFSQCMSGGPTVSTTAPLPPPTPANTFAFASSQYLQGTQLRQDTIPATSTQQKRNDVRHSSEGVYTEMDRQSIPTVVTSTCPHRLPVTHSETNSSAVEQLLLAAGSSIKKKKGIVSAPNTYITRGDNCHKIGLGEATWPEYFVALKRLAADPELPPHWLPYLYQHEEDLATMALVWDWATCRRWSERVFQMINDSRLPLGWGDRAAIKDVQRDICAAGTRANQHIKQLHSNRPDFQRSQSTYVPSSSSNMSASQQPVSTVVNSNKEEYNKETDGKPCFKWNWGNSCGYAGSHGELPDKHVHICAWCAYRFRRVLFHKEQDCNKKRRFLDTRLEASSDNKEQKQSVSAFGYSINSPERLNTLVVTQHTSQTLNSSFSPCPLVTHQVYGSNVAGEVAQAPRLDSPNPLYSSAIVHADQGFSPSQLVDSLPIWSENNEDILFLPNRYDRYSLPPISPASFKETLFKFWPHTVPACWAGFKTHYTLFNKVRVTGLPNYLAARIPVPSALIITKWRELLHSYPDKKLVDYLEFGWPLDYTAPVPPVPTLQNHEKDPDKVPHIRKFIQKEVQLGALLGPFSGLPTQPWFQISPMMTRPKKNSNERRIVVDMSFPRGRSVNAGITKGSYQGSYYSFSLPSVSEIGSALSKEGQGSWLWSTDLSRAYRQLRTCPLSYPLSGLVFNSNYYIDVAPSFGCRTSALACARTTQAVVWLMRKRGFNCWCYLDDFIGLQRTFERASEAFNVFLHLAASLGLQIALDKSFPPTNKLVWLGFAIDSTTMTLSIPEGKLEEIIVECERWKSITSATKKQIQSLAGKLQHISKCVNPATRFMNRILYALRVTPYVGSHILPPELRKDVAWFITFAKSFNGIVLLPKTHRKVWQIECDSTLSGGGAFSSSHYYAVRYPQELTEEVNNIAQLEALNLVHAFKFLLPPQPSDFKVIINTDNIGSQQVLSSGSGRDLILCACARQLWLLAAQNYCELAIEHKPGNKLILADALSRFHLDKGSKSKAQELCYQKNLQEIYIKFSLDILDSQL